MGDFRICWGSISMKVQAEWRMWRAEGCFAAITVVPGWIVNACFWCEIGHWSDAQQA